MDTHSSRLADRLELLLTLAPCSGRALDRLAAKRGGHLRQAITRLRGGKGHDIETGTLEAYRSVTGAKADWLLSGKGRAPTAKSIRMAVHAATLAASPAPVESAQ